MTAATGVAVLAVAACSSATTPQPQTAKVERASVTMGVSSPGSLSALTEQNLGFPKGGQLTAVMVKVGDHVDAGQPLASVDDFAAKQALATQEAQLKSQQAALAKLTSSPVVQGAQDTLAQAQSILDAVKNQGDTLHHADSVAIDSAQHQLDVDKDALDDADDAKDQACASDPSGSTPACQSAQSAYATAKAKVVADKTALSAAQQKRDVDDASSQVAIENAQQAVVTAQNSADSSSSDRPHNIAAQQALVDAASAAVAQAQHDVDNTTLKAPVAGTVSVLNGAVGEFLAASSGTSALAPGTDATIPGASGGSNGGGSITAGTPTRPGGTQFIVLDNIDQFQVVAPFNESDAAAIAPNQNVNVTFDAVPDLTVPATVVSVAPTGTSISGVISYYVTVALSTSDPRLKAGQTANVGIVTSETPNVLTVPSSAVRKQDGKSVVTVLGPSGPQQVPFQPGAVGMDRTEVVSGLQEGQQVLLPVGQ